MVSTLSQLNHIVFFIGYQLSLARRCHFKGFTELDSIHLKISPQVLKLFKSLASTNFATQA